MKLRSEEARRQLQLAMDRLQVKHEEEAAAYQAEIRQLNDDKCVLRGDIQDLHAEAARVL